MYSVGLSDECRATLRQNRTDFYKAVEDARRQTAQVNMLMDLELPTMGCAKRYLVSLLYDSGTVKRVAR